MYSNWPITFLARSIGYRVTPTSFGSEFLAMAGGGGGGVGVSLLCYNRRLQTVLW